MGKSARKARTQLNPGRAGDAPLDAPSIPIAPFGQLKSHWRPSAGLSFWISFLLLHVLLFLPVVLMDREDGTLLPSIHFASLSLEQIWVSIAVWRREPDLLRFNSEIVLFVALWALVRPLRHVAVRILFRSHLSLRFLSITFMRAPLSPFSASNLFSIPSCAWQPKDSASFCKNARVTTAFVAGILVLIGGGAALVAPNSALRIA